eukprot:5972772-Pyramimonas_sp.AAC.1
MEGWWFSNWCSLGPHKCVLTVRTSYNDARQVVFNMELRLKVGHLLKKTLALAPRTLVFETGNNYNDGADSLSKRGSHLSAARISFTRSHQLQG